MNELFPDRRNNFVLWPTIIRSGAPGSTEPGHSPSDGHQSRRPDCGHLLPERPILLLEPGRAHAGNPAVIKAISVGENVIDYVTGRQLPPDKLSEPLGGPANKERAGITARIELDCADAAARGPFPRRSVGTRGFPVAGRSVSKPGHYFRRVPKPSTS